jgi:sulfide:quinone oxidoreductase
MPRVVIAGGGFAAVETLLALRALGGAAIEVELVSLHEAFAYRPAATTEPFAGGPRLAFDLADLAADLSARHRVDRVEAVDPARRVVRLASGGSTGYEALVLAVGAQLRTSLPGALMFTGQRDEPFVGALLEDVDAGVLGSLAFAVPEGVTWPLPVYELALLTAAALEERGWRDVPVTVVTPERSPLEGLGDAASELMAPLLAERGVRFRGGSAPVAHEAGRLVLRSGGAVAADRVVAVPAMTGREIGGIPRGPDGFTPTDARGRVRGLDMVFAAGDMVVGRLKHGGLATQQADAVAADILARFGLAAPAAARARAAGPDRRRAPSRRDPRDGGRGGRAARQSRRVAPAGRRDERGDEGQRPLPRAVPAHAWARPRVGVTGRGRILRRRSIGGRWSDRSARGILRRSRARRRATRTTWSSCWRTTTPWSARACGC